MSGVSVEDRGRARWITLDRPDCRNALDPDVLGALRAGVDGAVAAGARAIVIVGRSGAFCSGADLRYAVAQGPALIEDVETHLAHFQDLVRALVSSPLPTIAAVDGVAYGFGCDLALACDLRVADRSAVFALPPARLGLAYPLDGLRDLVAAIGLSAAKEMIFTARRLPADDALRIGLIDRVTADIDAETDALCAEIAQGAPLSITHAKRALDFITGRPGHEDEAEITWLAARCFYSEDYAEGRKAFAEKRKPVFRGT